jgi:indolepyruvate ferredoxin oxidoreductase beta subunit
MTYDILLAGVGGQGVLSIAAVISSAAMEDGLFVRQSEVHGMSQRGGGVQAHLRLSDKPVDSDLIPLGKADMILSMEPVESLRYLSWLSTAGVLITSDEPIINIPDYPDVEEIYRVIRSLPKSHIVQVAALARDAGNLKAENMVLVGAALGYIPVNADTVEASIRSRFGKKDPKLVEINLKALELGAQSRQE